ncbi:unnamed protein product [Rotaria sp. Silwood2]|nr:unnamed protein product [Rotaria sp. Silwood2]CAF3020414.1 unnamed protein product [Rotaria sp. Silwood2]CAF3372308.1 unnamed protein product [Rotaria sp. Silwood2]CAF3381129.1 unnamed protein product [Rotaria sp. Silwood2]CAF4160370.1 unnamed protein product [Rotaria sp. Silwood2]
MSQRSQQQGSRMSHNYSPVLALGGIRDPASKFPNVAALRDTYDRDYIHGNRDTRNRYAQTYAAIAFANPNVLPLPIYDGNEDLPYKIPDPRNW